MKVLLVGGRGYFGRLLAAELGAFEVVAPTSRELDLKRPETFGPWLDGADAVVCAAGPFQALPTTLAQACLERARPYIDLADDRAFVAAARALAARTPPRALFAPGWSTVSALSALLTRLALNGCKAAAIRVFMAPGNRGERGRATVVSLLSSVGRFFDLDGRRVRGWSQPRCFQFPPPIGRRVGYVVDSADHDVLPAVFGAPAEFRAGSELAGLNAAASVLAYSAEALSVRWSAYAPLFAAALRPLARFGTTAGGVGVEVELAGGGLRRASLVAGRDAPRMAVLPAVVLLDSLAAGAAPAGSARWDAWTDRAGLERYCARFGFRLSFGDG